MVKLMVDGELVGDDSMVHEMNGASIGRTMVRQGVTMVMNGTSIAKILMANDDGWAVPTKSSASNCHGVSAWPLVVDDGDA